MSFAQDLRASVLQAAMQGKLTGQLKTDTPVSELLNKMNIKPKFNEDGIAPDSWEWVEMQDIVTLEKGTKIENKKLPYLEARYLRTGTDAKMYTIGEFVAKETNVILVDGENSGEVFLVPEDGYMGSTFKVLSINKEMNKDFILQILLFYKETFRQSKKGSAIPHLNKKLFKEIMVAVPPIEEQKRIVRRIEEIMKHIDELEAIEEELKKLKSVFPADMKAAVLQAAMRGKLTEQLDTDSSVDDLLEDIKKEREKLVAEGKIKKSRTKQNDNFVELEDVPFGIPSSWKWVKIKDVVVFLNGRAYKQHEMLESGKYPLLRVGNFFTNDKWYYSDLELDKDKYCDNGDLLYAWSASFGPKIWDKNKSIFHYHIWKIKYDQLLFDKKYLYYYFLFDKEKISSATRGLTMVHVSMAVMNERYIAIPPIEEQRRIVDKLETILPLIEDI